jgi:hypothetical protein
MVAMVMAMATAMVMATVMAMAMATGMATGLAMATGMAMAMAMAIPESLRARALELFGDQHAKVHQRQRADDRPTVDEVGRGAVHT